MGVVKNEDGAAAFGRSGMFARQFDGQALVLASGPATLFS